MNRRDFLKLSGAITGGAVISPWISSCAAGPVVVKQAAKTVGVWFLQYLFKLAADEVYNSIKEFVANQTTEEASKISRVNEAMGEGGFTETDGRKVYLCNGIYLYEVGHEDQFNGCAASFDGRKNNLALVEGPTVVGLAKAAEDYRNNGYSSSETRDTLLLNGTYQTPSYNAFGRSYDQPYVAYTDFGTVLVDYSVLSSNSGQVDVSIADRDAIERFRGTYPIEFS